MQKIADGLPWKMPATIDDPAILEAITAVLQAHGQVSPNTKAAAG
jgi:propionyl-CoA synthetase